ncbi:MBL fold metallo-hydrolase [Streptomyces sp. MUM 2J]|uniref:MBL fold metallo-hydrolase n=1 Tax=Streptomyces sp. MUM 2J TaxID=2791987 RepID=UPI001F03A72E|nr:MBL fold metallo-hydrolase [Streptomyces sp. MUM 2J]MCH0567250.1 MBL fold metallo-hydrolase [Streptomyces sp. MUM 2J]
MREVAKGVFCVSGTDVNWVLVREGSDLTLIDGGWPGDVGAVEASIRALGCRPEDVRAMLLTHAHADHVGALPHLSQRYGVPSYMDSREVAHARGEHREQATPLEVLKRIWHPGALPWALRITRAGALRHHRVPDARAFPHEGPLDLPGHPKPIACYGHTSGHSAYHLAEAGVVVTGDALVTGHPLSDITGPQMLPRFFAAAPQRALTALDNLAELDAETLLPGHGDPWHGSPRTAAAIARDHS